MLSSLYTWFQSTLPRREWPDCPDNHHRRISDFNPHSHEGSDRRGWTDEDDSSEFQSTLPRREWRLLTMATGIWYYFNPHSHEGSDQLSPVSLQKHADFNPHSHEGSDFILSLHVFITVISIHTPTKGVTCFQIQREQSAQISIHTPTKGVTIKQYYFFLPDPISIHTPTKGVTG